MNAAVVRVGLESPDQPEVVQLIAELDAYQDTLYPPESRHALDLASLKQPQVLFAVARDADGTAIGCGAIVLGREHGEVKRMYVHPRARGRGVARQVLALLESRAQAQQCLLLRLETGPRQPEALAFYARVGYRERGPFGAYRDDPLSVFMEKQLQPADADTNVTTLAQLRTLYPAPKERALKKQLSALEPHSHRFIALSPFLVMATGSAGHTLDASPRGGAPGFVKALDDRTLLIPDAPGNHRLDSLHNILETGQIGLIFMIPGVDETLRINGAAWLSRQPSHLGVFAAEKHPPRVVICVTVNDVYLHCAKALMRSRLWQTQVQLPRSALPTMGEMIRGQTGLEGPVETQEQMLARYAADL